MPKPFLDLSIEQFADLIVDFPWERTVSTVHLHHTFRPNHADFASRPPVQSIEAMFRFHTETRGCSDIAQHVTIDPSGRVWTGRSFNMPPASAAGFNGNNRVGPFMIEMIGNFDRGNDRWTDPQRDAAIRVTALVQRLHRLPPSAFQFHSELSSNTCPGTAISRDEVLASLQAAHNALPAGAFERRGSRDAVVRLLNVGPKPAGPARDEGELPEGTMTVREVAMSSGEAGAFSAARGGDDRELTPGDLQLLRKHVINLRMGALSSGGVFQSTREDVLAIFNEHLPQYLEARRPQPLRLVFFAHGGLNEEIESLKNARNRIPFYLANQCYPLFFVWETGVKETLVDIVGELIGLGPGRDADRALSDAVDRGFEAAFRNAGFAMWANMKRSAEVSFLPNQGGSFVVEQIAELWKRHSAEMEIHAIGHSAGSIFHAYFLARLCAHAANPRIDVTSLHFLAPAITVDLFKDTLLPLIGSRVARFTEFTMHRDFEEADKVGPYGKSLLCLVSRSFEDRAEMPILGLEESIRRDPDLVRFFGLFGKKPGKGALLFSPTDADAGPSHSTIAKAHGDFDNDRFTMAGVIRRILDIPDSVAITEFPETASRSILDRLPPTAAPDGATFVPPRAFIAALPSGSNTPPVAGPGRRRALCVGIDDYAGRNRLNGCINDARDWATALQGHGFDVTLLTDQGATWEALTSALTALVADARRGDVLAFQYAGHGTQVNDVDGDEHGARDSALCPIDFDSGRLLIDDDVRRIFAAVPDGVTLTCFFDCCHSGTITRLAAPGPMRTIGDVRSRFIVASQELEQAHREFRARRRAPAQRGPATMKEVSFTACTDAQTAHEVDGHGQFTLRAVNILRQRVGGLTNAAFHGRVLAAFGSDANAQTPQLDCAPAARTALFLAGPADAATDLHGDERSVMLARLDRLERRLEQIEERTGA